MDDNRVKYGTRNEQPFEMMTMIVAVLVLATGSAFAAEWPGEAAPWRGHGLHRLQIDNHPVQVYIPQTPYVEKPWLLLDTGEAGDVEAVLLNRGFHVVVAELPDRYGSPAALEVWDAVYKAMTEQYGLHNKVALKGFGAGGLQVHYWASENAEKVACLVADCPVVDFKAWLAGTGKTAAQPDRWQAFMQAHGYESEEDALESKRNPIEMTASLAKEKTPILHLSKYKDSEGPYKDQTAAFQKAYVDERGFYMTVIMKPNEAPKKGLQDPLAIANFILTHTLDGACKPEARLPKSWKDWRIADFERTGAVYVEGDVLLLEMGNDMSGITRVGEFPKMNYEITLDAMRVGGDDFFCGLTFPVNDDPCSLVLGGWGGTTCGLSCLDYNDAANNETTRYREFNKGQWYAVRLWVTPDRIQAWVDDEELVDVNTEGRDIDIRWEMEPCVPLGIATWRTSGAIRNIRIRELTDAEVKEAVETRPKMY
ncbi:MAG: hypothetical protein R6V12_02540 [Candidatus Hydrogenedentota bacterium]